MAKVPDDRTAILSSAEVEAALDTTSQDRPCLTLMSGPDVGKVYRIEREMILGRSERADIRLAIDGVSRKHARVYIEDSTIYVEDLGSTNGTFINAIRLTEPELVESGDKIRLGPKAVLRFAYQDVMEEELNRELYEAALRDSMTRIYNKRYLLERLEAEFAYATRHKTPLSLIMFDLDHFKKLNDNYGHLAGDQVLIQISESIGASIRTEDTFARYGGEEFSIICRGSSPDHARLFAMRLVNLVRHTKFEYQGERLPVTVSMGIAHLLPDGVLENIEAFIDKADEALYAAKRSGRNRLVEAPRE